MSDRDLRIHTNRVAVVFFRVQLRCGVQRHKVKNGFWGGRFA